ncbi:MAG: putative serine/threonine kinase anti-sigma factor [Acidimicrobiaceae bacterium]|nr:putative serine/threonine kinase anti-sigma factor [Acidimicrobiaceae bacterium]
MQISFGLRLPPEAQSVPVVRGLCRLNLRELGVEEQCVSDVCLAVTEACTNVVLHAETAIAEYEVRVDFDAEHCAIRVVDTGAGFDPEVLERQAAAIFEESGRGIEIMRKLMDRLSFSSPEHRGTVVLLEKHLTVLEDSPLRSLSHDADVVPLPTAVAGATSVSNPRPSVATGRRARARGVGRSKPVRG